LKWIRGADICPVCGRGTEILTDGRYNYAERCLPCKWEIVILKKEDVDNEK